MTNATPLTYDTVVERIRTAVRKIRGATAGNEDIGPDTAFWSAGGSEQPSLAFDSLDFLELIVLLEEEYGWKVPESGIDAEDCRTVADLADLVLATVAERADGSS